MSSTTTQSLFFPLGTSSLFPLSAVEGQLVIEQVPDGGYRAWIVNGIGDLWPASIYMEGRPCDKEDEHGVHRDLAIPSIYIGVINKIMLSGAGKLLKEDPTYGIGLTYLNVRRMLRDREPLTIHELSQFSLYQYDPQPVEQ